MRCDVTITEDIKALMDRAAAETGGIDVVFSGHEHIYERAELQGGILYFITVGAGAGLRTAAIAQASPIVPYASYELLGLDVAFQAIKYQSRDGWAHRDLLRLAHPVAASPFHGAVFDWAVRGWPAVGPDPHDETRPEPDDLRP